MDFSEGKTAFIDVTGLSPSTARVELSPEWKNRRYKVILKARFVDHCGVENYVYERNSGMISYGIAAASHFFETTVSEDA